MADEYIVRKEHEISVHDGDRMHTKRRVKPRRNKGAPGIFAMNLINKRKDDDRRKTDDRRVPENVNDMECIIERGGSFVVGVSFLFLALTFVVMGATFLPVVGYIVGIVLGIAGVNSIFSPTRKGCGFFLKKDSDKT